MTNSVYHPKGSQNKSSGTTDFKQGVDIPFASLVNEASTIPQQHPFELLFPPFEVRRKWVNEQTRDYELSHAESRILLEHTLNCGTPRGSYPSIETMASITGYSQRTVRRTHVSLVERGLLIKNPKRRPARFFPNYMLSRNTAGLKRLIAEKAANKQTGHEYADAASGHSDRPAAPATQDRAAATGHSGLPTATQAQEDLEISGHSGRLPDEEPTTSGHSGRIQDPEPQQDTGPEALSGQGGRISGHSGHQKGRKETETDVIEYQSKIQSNSFSEGQDDRLQEEAPKGDRTQIKRWYAALLDKLDLHKLPAYEELMEIQHIEGFSERAMTEASRQYLHVYADRKISHPVNLFSSIARDVMHRLPRESNSVHRHADRRSRYAIEYEQDAAARKTANASAGAQECPKSSPADAQVDRADAT